MTHFEGGRLVGEWWIAADPVNGHPGLLRRWWKTPDGWDWEERWADADEIRAVMQAQEGS